MQLSVLSRLTVLLIFIATPMGSHLKSQNSAIDRTYIKIEVHGLSCPFCAYGLEKNLKSIEGVENVVISVSESAATLSVPKDKEPTKKRLKKVVKDAGFTAKEIKYSDKPFKEG